MDSSSGEANNIQFYLYRKTYYVIKDFAQLCATGNSVSNLLDRYRSPPSPSPRHPIPAAETPPSALRALPPISRPIEGIYQVGRYDSDHRGPDVISREEILEQILKDSDTCFRLVQKFHDEYYSILHSPEGQRYMACAGGDSTVAFTFGFCKDAWLLPAIKLVDIYAECVGANMYPDNALDGLRAKKQRVANWIAGAVGGTRWAQLWAVRQEYALQMYGRAT